MPRTVVIRELTFEIPLEQEPETRFLADLLSHVERIQFTRLDSRGFLFICRVPKSELAVLRRKLKSNYGFHEIHAGLVMRDKSGSEVLQVSGRWFKTKFLTKPARLRAMRFFRTIERAPLYNLRNTTFDKGTLRLSVVGDDKTIKKLREGFEQFNVPYSVASLGRPRTAGGPVLDRLTITQMNILRLAHAMGYYSIPRKTRTEDLGRLLRMDKGTVGEHLRRAEKNVFDGLLNS
jgi:hypothetical protein